jgi:hypothetical protein
MLHNVSAVTDVFLHPIRKNVVEQNRTKGVSPTAVLRNPNRPFRAVSSYNPVEAVGNILFLLFHHIIQPKLLLYFGNNGTQFLYPFLHCLYFQYF